MKKTDGRRLFLKNTSLSVLTVAATPTILNAMSSSRRKKLDNSILTCNESTEDAYGQGPFYTPGAPTIQNNTLADSNEIGTRLIISGRVHNLDCTEVYRLLLARRKNAIFLFLNFHPIIRCKIKATHIALSFLETRNNPLFPEVPVDSPTVNPFNVGEKSLLFSERVATSMAFLRSTPFVFISLKFPMNSFFSSTGKSGNFLLR